MIKMNKIYSKNSKNNSFKNSEKCNMIRIYNKIIQEDVVSFRLFIGGVE